MTYVIFVQVVRQLFFTTPFGLRKESDRKSLRKTLLRIYLGLQTETINTYKYQRTSSFVIGLSEMRERKMCLWKFLAVLLLEMFDDRS